MPYKNRHSPEVRAKEAAYRAAYKPKKDAYMRRYHSENRERNNARCSRWYNEHKEAVLAEMKAYAKSNPEVNKAATKRYREKMRQDPAWCAKQAARAASKRAANPEAARAYSRKMGNAEYQRRYPSDPVYRLRRQLRCKLKKRLRQQNAEKTATTFELIGCSIDELRVHLQKQFKPGMAWNNYGYHGWHIDHIRPLATFDLLDPAQQRAAFSYKNLQPLWGVENLIKGDRVI